MGSIVSAQGELMAKNQEKMVQNQKEMMLKQRQMQLAQQFAMGKDRFMYYQVFYYLCCFGLFAKALKEKNPTSLFPLVPLSFVFAYQYDMYYLNKMERVRKEAERLIREEPDLFFPAVNNGIVTEEEYKKIFNIQEKNGKKIN